MLYCRTQKDEPVVIGVEGKATETFDNPVTKWIRDGGIEPTESRVRRLQFLADLLGKPIPRDATFGYQLVHRTASVVSECILHARRREPLLFIRSPRRTPRIGVTFSSLQTSSVSRFRTTARMRSTALLNWDQNNR